MVVVVRTRVSQVTPESPGTPHAMVYGLYVLSPAIRPWVVTVIGSVLTADLTPALRRQDHTLSLVRLGAVRPTAPPRPPLPRPASVTLRDAPLSGTGCKSYRVIFTSGKQKYFYHRGLTRHNQNTTDLPDGSSHHSLKVEGEGGGANGTGARQGDSVGHCGSLGMAKCDGASSLH
jgi:hypothetical protein